MADSSMTDNASSQVSKTSIAFLLNPVEEVSKMSIAFLLNPEELDPEELNHEEESIPVNPQQGSTAVAAAGSHPLTFAPGIFRLADPKPAILIPKMSQPSHPDILQFYPRGMIMNLEPPNHRTYRAGPLTTIRAFHPNNDRLTDWVSLADAPFPPLLCVCGSAKCRTNPPDFSKLFGDRIVIALWYTKICVNNDPVPSNVPLDSKRCGAFTEGNVFWDCKTRSLYKKCPNPQCVGKWVVAPKYGRLMTEEEKQSILAAMAYARAHKEFQELRGKTVDECKHQREIFEAGCTERKRISMAGGYTAYQCK